MCLTCVTMNFLQTVENNEGLTTKRMNYKLSRTSSISYSCEVSTNNSVDSSEHETSDEEVSLS